MLEGPKKIQWMNRCRKSAMALVVGKWTWAEIGYPKMGREWVNPLYSETIMEILTNTNIENLKQVKTYI